jgi:O-antigen/teichoic acid export membrane protein
LSCCRFNREARNNKGNTILLNQKSRLLLNTVINVGNNILTLFLNFLLLPFIIGIIGRGPYGVWIILGSLFAYANMLQMGLNSSTTRLVPFLLAQKREKELNRQLNTVVAYFIFLSIIIAFITLIFYKHFLFWFSVEVEYHETVKTMILITGAAYTISLPFLAYGAVLSGLQRFEYSVGLDSIGGILRALVIFIVLPNLLVTEGMILIAGISALVLVISSFSKAVFAFRICPEISMKPWIFNIKALWQQLIYGINSIIYVLSGLLFSRIAIIAIAIIATTRESADYGIAMMPILAGAALVSAINRGVKPAASRYHGENNFSMLRILLLRTSRYNSVVLITIAITISVFGAPFFELWVGEEYATFNEHKILLTIIDTSLILLVGYFWHWLSEPSYQVINGVGKHFFPAAISIIAGIVASILIFLIAKDWPTIDKVALGLVIPMLITWGILMPKYCCSIVGISLKLYFKDILLKPILACTPAAISSYLLLTIFYPESWAMLFVQLLLLVTMLLFLSWRYILLIEDKKYFISIFDSVKKNVKTLIFRKEV